MKRIAICLVVVCVVAFAGVTANAQGPVETLAQGLVKSISDGCKTELEKYCKKRPDKDAASPVSMHTGTSCRAGVSTRSMTRPRSSSGPLPR